MANSVQQTVSGSNNESSTAATSAAATAAATGSTAVTPAAVDPAFQKQLDDLKSELEESKRATEFWHGKAKSSEKPAAAAVADEPEEDILEAITTKGAKGLDAILAKRGYVRAVDVDAKVNARAEALTKEQQLLEQYPDLKKKDSEFFKQAAMFYGELVKANTSPAVAMEMAAERTELKFMREGKIKTPSQQAEDAKAQREKDRRARIAAQSGESGGRTSAAADEEDDELTDVQKNIARSMGISEDAYKARAKKGVAMKGIK